MASEKAPGPKPAGTTIRTGKPRGATSARTGGKSPEIISRVRQLAWSGLHADAIHLASQKLDDLGAGRQNASIIMDLLDLRAESYIAIGRLDLAAKDSGVMLKLANTEKKAALKARALNRRTLLEMRQGNLKAALKTAASALRQSQQAKQKPLIAESLFRLSEAQWRTQENEAAIENAQKAIRLYQELEDDSGAGRAYWSLANAYSNILRSEDVRITAQAALRLCQSAGDQYGIGNALNALTLVDPDIAERIEHTQQARQAFEAAGYAERQAVALGNLSLSYFELGLHSHARRMQSEVVEMNRAMGTKVGLTYSLGNLMETEISTGDFDLARQHLEEFTGLVPDLGDPTQDAGLAAARGNLALAEGNLRAAINHYKSALKISETAKLGRENIFLTEIGKAQLANHAPAAALKATARAASLHRALAFTKPDGYLSQAIWWRHAQALNANGKIKEAREALDLAYDFLTESINNIRDVGLRRNYLNKVDVNREIIQFWVKDGAKRRLSKERIYSYLNIESNLREPFKRLADTGLRLNTLRDIAEIQTFLVDETTELTGAERVLFIVENNGKLEVAEAQLPRGEEVAKVLASIKPHLASARLTRTTQLVLPAGGAAMEEGLRRSTYQTSSSVRGLSRIIAPLIAQNNVLGYLYVDMSSLYGRFDETDRDMLGMLANQGAVALDNAGLLEGLEQKVQERTEQLNARADELAILNSVGEAMAKTLDVTTVTKIVGDKVRDIFNAEVTEILLHDPASDLIHVPYAFAKEYQEVKPFAMGKGLTSRVLLSGEPLVLGTFKQAIELGSLAPTDKDITESYMGVPIVVGDRKLGVVSVQSYQPNAFNENQLRLLQTLSANMGVAIENARLFEAEQSRVAELAIINSVQEGLSSKLEFQSIIDLVGDKIVDIFESQLVAIMLYDRQTNYEIYPYIFEKGRRLQQDPIAHDNKGFGPQAMRTRQPVLINSDMKNRMEEVGSYLIGGEEDTPRSSIYAPLLVGNEARGVVSIGAYDRENAFSDSDVRLLQTMANAMSVALENARLFDETQRLFKAEQERVAELQIINSIQQGLAAELDFQAIVDLVGDKLREVFNTGDLGIDWYDEQANLVHYLYLYEHNKRLTVASRPPNPQGILEHLRKTRKPVVFNSIADYEKFNAATIPGTEQGKSYAAVPIISGDRVLGDIGIENYERENAFGESELRLLTTIAASLGTALENARLFHETQRLLKITEDRAAELAIINSVQAALAAELNIQGIYNAVGDKIREIFQNKDVGIRIYDPRTNMLHFPYAFESGERVEIKPILISTAGFSSHVLRTRETIVINENMEAAEKKYGSYTIPGTKSEKSKIIVPLVAGDQARGLITLDDYESEHAFSDSDVRLLQTLANAMSVALENARLFDETQRLLKETEQRNAELAIINSVQAALAAKLDMQGIYDAVGDKIREIFDAQSVQIVTYDRQSNMMSYPYIIEKGNRLTSEALPLDGTGIMDHVITEGQPVMINTDLLARTKELTGAEAVLVGEGGHMTKSRLDVPMIIGGETWGGISLQNVDHENAFTESDLRLLQTLANSMGVALENARLFDETQRLLKETEQRNAELAIINSVQEGLASKLEIQAIFDLVGNEVRDLFDAQVVVISTVDQKANIRHDRYVIERGQRFHLEPRQLDDGDGGGFGGHVIRTRQPILINKDVSQRGLEFGSTTPPAGEEALSILYVPLLVGDEAKGLISLQNLDREEAFSEADVRLLSTLASSMSVALENARLFDETTRLFKAEQERAAELAIINSIQQGLASKLDLQAIVDLVGDKLREVLNTNEIGIRLYDEQSDLVHYPYEFEHGERLAFPPQKPSILFRQMANDQQPIFGSTTEIRQKFNLTLMPGTESSLAIASVPIIAGSKVIGFVAVESFEREDYFNEANIRLMQTIAASMGVALESARLFDETTRLFKAEQERAAELAIINSIQQGLASKLELQAIVDLVGDKLSEVLNTNEIGIRLYDESTDLVRYLYEFEHGERLEIESQKPTTMFRQMISDKQPIFGRTRDIIKRFKSATVPGTESSKAIAVVPIIAGSKVIGAVSVESFEREDYFNEANIRLMQTIAASMGVALESARLFDETTRLLKETEQRNAELAVINSIQQGVAASLDFKTIIDLVGDKLREVLNTGDLGIRWYDYQQKLVHYMYEYEHGERLTVPSRAPIIGWEALIQRREPLVRNTAAEVAAAGTLPGTDTSMSNVAVPIVGSDRVIGSIIVEDYDREYAYSDSDVRLLTTVASSMGVALENARLFDETQRLLKETEERNAELAVINSVQAALAAELNIQGIYDAVGDKIHEIFHNTDMNIRIYDPRTNLIQFPYIYENGERLNLEPALLAETGFAHHVLHTRETVVINQNLIEEEKKYGSFTLPGTESEMAVLFVPLVVGDQARGLINLASMRENAFSDSDVRLLQTLANSMSVALENARLFDETQRLLKETEQRNAELAIINKVQQGLASKLEMQAIYDLVGDEIKSIFDAQAVLIVTYDPQANLFHYPYNIEKGERYFVEPTEPIGFSEVMIKTRQPILIKNNFIERYGEITGKPLVHFSGEEPKSWLGVPLLVGNEVRGTISLQNVDREEAYGESDLRLLNTLAGTMSVALENARLFDETQRLLQVTEQRAQELAIINSVQEGLASKLDVQGIVDLVGDKICTVFGIQDMFIGLYDRTTKLIHYPYGITGGTKDSYDPVELGRGLSSHVIQMRSPLVINADMQRRSAELGAIMDRARYQEIKSWLGVPIVVGNEAIGLISLQEVTRENAFAESQVNLLTTLANSMSVALENARLFDETTRLLKETEQRAAELSIINSVQEGLASKLEMQVIYDLVGDKICEIFNLQTCFIMVYDKEAETEHYPYLVEDGVRQKQESIAHDEKGFGPLVMRTRQPIMINEDMVRRSEEVGSYIIGGGGEPKAAIYVPLLIGNQAKGVISVQNTQHEHAFTESDLRLLTTLASSMSVALESARLFAETEQRAAELAIINSVQQGLASKLEIQAIYELVGEKLRELFDMQAISLVSFDLEKNTYHYHYLLEKGQRLDVPDAAITPMGKHIIRTRKTLLVNERVEESLAKIGVALNIIPGTEPTKALLRVPILIGRKVRGFIGLSNLEKENAFSDSDVRLLETLASSLSVALESARLFEETKRNAAELATVNTVSSALASELDTGALIQLVGEQIRAIFRAEIAYVALLDEEGRTINFPYQYGEDVEPMPYGEGLTSKIIQTSKPLLINAEVNREAEQIGATFVGIDVQSYLGVPILVGGKAVGVVSVQSTSHEDAFDENDQRLLGTIAANVGSALHNAQLYREAQESRAAAEQANKAKSTFLANMSHELRTPLNAIIGFTRIVRRKADGALPDKQIENLDKVLSSSEHLLGLINTVLDIAKIEAGRMDVIPANFNIAGLVETCANLAAPLVKPTVSLERHIDESLGLIYSDQDKIKQIVINLLSNAAKFTPEGKIVLSVDRADEDTLEISVSDSGIGISEEALGRIFEEFQQADTSTTREYGGTGLGLAISRSLSRLLGGDLTATSELGKGSTFTLSLPIKYGTKPAKMGMAGASAPVKTETRAGGEESRKTILVIDDDPDAVYLLQESLNAEEFKVIGSRNGHDGLQVAREQKPDVILLDILMPEMDGWQVLNDLKEDQQTSAIPVILLTIVDKKALGFRLGAAAYLLKPLDPVAVLDTLRRVIGDKGQEHKHALVVDDDPNVAEMLRQILTEPEFELESAEDGEAGLQAIQARRPDIILLDLMMPKLDGFGVIERLRADPETRNIPIIVISAKELTDDESKKLRSTVAFVMKKQGFDSQKLIEELNDVLHTQRL